MYRVALETADHADSEEGFRGARVLVDVDYFSVSGNGSCVSLVVVVLWPEGG